MKTSVECGHCGARYETEAPVAAIKEVGRCDSCGVTALVVVEDDEAPVQAEEARE